MYVNLEDSPFVAAALGAGNSGSPVEEVVVGREEGNGAEIFLLEVGDLAVNALQRCLEDINFRGGFPRGYRLTDVERGGGMV